jgi:hypothetical protein
MMNADTVYKYLGIAVVAVALLHVLLKASSVQNDLIFGQSSLTGISALSPLAPSPLIEGMTGDAASADDSAFKKIANQIKDNTTKITDKLNIGQNWKAYDEILVQLDQYVKMGTLNAVITFGTLISDASTDQKVSMNLITLLNTYKEFSSTLNFASKALDSDPNYKKR